MHTLLLTLTSALQCITQMCYTKSHNNTHRNRTRVLLHVPRQDAAKHNVGVRAHKLFFIWDRQSYTSNYLTALELKHICIHAPILVHHLIIMAYKSTSNSRQNSQNFSFSMLKRTPASKKHNTAIAGSAD